MNGREKAAAVLPPDHQLGMRVPLGGSSCSRCEYLHGPRECGNPGFVHWNDGEGDLPAPADQYCCDLYEIAKEAATAGAQSGGLGSLDGS